MVRWGLAGCGDISNKRVAPALKNASGSTLAAAFSPFSTELDEFTHRHSVPKAYSEYPEMLKDPEIDAVYVATPVYLHYEPALLALRAGKHVLVEKPMALENSQCETLVSEAADRGLKLGVAYFRRFFPKLEDVRKLISEGVIGDVIQVRILYHSWYDAGRGETAGWRGLKKKAGGGPLWDMGCHKFDMLIHLLGMPSTVSAVMSTLTHGTEVEDSCSAVLELENGAHCLASFNWNSRVWSDEFEILGTNGKIVMNPCDSENIAVRLNPRVLKGMGREETTISRPNHLNVHFPLVQDFVNAIAENREPVVSGAEGYKTNRILAAIGEAAATGRKIYI